MYYKVIFFIIIAISINANAQMNNVFSLKQEFSSKINVNVFLYNCGHYEIILQENCTNDIIDEYILSSGKYTLKGNQIICRDWFNGFVSKFTNKGDSITLSSSFNFIKNKTFVKSKFQIHEAPDIKSSDIDKLCTIRNNYKNTLPVKNDFQLGVYKSQIGFKLELDEDSTYRFIYENIIISRGKWLNSKIEITLHDIDLNHSFYVIKGNNELINLMFPWFSRFLLYKYQKSNVPKESEIYL